MPNNVINFPILIYLLCSGTPCRRTRTSVSSATTHFTSFNYILKCTLNDQCVSIQITLMSNLAIISQILDNQLMFALFICKKTSWLLYVSIDSLDWISAPAHTYHKHTWGCCQPYTLIAHMEILTYWWSNAHFNFAIERSRVNVVADDNNEVLVLLVHAGSRTWQVHISFHSEVVKHLKIWKNDDVIGHIFRSSFHMPGWLWYNVRNIWIGKVSNQMMYKQLKS